MTILGEIISYKREYISRCKGVISLSEQRSLVPAGDVIGNFVGVLSCHDLGVIAEMKRSSPSTGLLPKSSYPTYPDKVSENYCKAGASAVSVLTDIKYFDGNVNDLRKVRDVTYKYNVPVLVKDFIIDEYQLYQYRFYGADAILLIMGILDSSHYAELFALCVELGMEPLVEVYSEEELDIALSYGRPRVIGVNNRNLRNFEVDLGVFGRVSSYIPEGVLKVALSGMRSVSDVRMMRAAGADAVLIGESLMRGRFKIEELVGL